MRHGAKDRSVLIVGGGMAGSACALGLAQRGINSQVIDKNDFPREKVCGEGLLPEGLNRLQNLVGQAKLSQVQGQPFAGIHYRCGDLEAKGTFRNETGLGLRRSAIDHLLADLSEASPHVHRHRAQIQKIIREDDGFVALGKNGERFRGEVLIAADGMNSRSRRLLGLDRPLPRRKRYALRRHFKLSNEKQMPDYVEVSACAGFESYVTPVSPQVVGVAFLVEEPLMKADKKALGERWEDLLHQAHPALRARLAGAVPLGPAQACGPLNRRARKVYDRNAFLIGDAAGFVDAITGEGMSLALHGAELASEAIGQAWTGQTSMQRAGKNYTKAWRKHFQNYAALTHGLLWLIQDKTRLSRAIARLGQKPELFTDLLELNQGRKSWFSLNSLKFAELLLPTRTSLPKPPASLTSP